MKKEELYKAIGQIDDELIKEAENQPLKKHITKWVSLVASFAIIVTGFIIAPKIINNNKNQNENGIAGGGVISNNSHATSSTDGDNGSNSQATSSTDGDNSSNSQDTSSIIMTGEVAVDVTIWVDDKSYYPTDCKTLSINEITNEQQGELICTLNDGIEVYKYLPLSCDAVVLVKKQNKFTPYLFMNFKSYDNNSDEDAIEYLKIYGIKKAEDLKSVKIDNISLNKEQINTFYKYFSVLKNSSEEYFKAIEQNVPKAKENTQEYDGNTESGVTSSSSNSGSTALDNSRIIQIEAVNGLSFETYYYPNIEFISRHKASKEFCDFLNSL